MGSRDEFPESIKRTLRERVGGKCSRPECRRLTVSPNNEDADRVDVTGRAAHITAAASNGPRFDANLLREERRSAKNGIWLCSDCADLIDKNDGKGFAVQQLRTWKRTAEQAVSNSALLQSRTRRPAWLDGMMSPHYVNVPRLLHMVGSGALSDQTLSSIEGGFPENRFIATELLEVATALRRMTIETVDVRDITDPATQLMPGLRISYQDHCRTKNGASEDPENVTNYSFEKSPLIYLDCNEYRYIQPYDPIWLTTNTARGTVGLGSCSLAGIALVKSVDHSTKRVLASPLTFGIPDALGAYS